MQHLPPDIEKHLLSFLYLDESAKLATANKQIINLHNEMLMIKANEILPLLDYHCAKANLKEMKTIRRNLINCCWDEHVRKGYYCACARNRYVPIIKNLTNNVKFLSNHYLCKCQQQKTITICNPSIYLISISRHLSDHHQFLRVLEAIKYGMFKNKYKDGGNDHFFQQMYDWLKIKKINNIFAQIPTKKKAKRRFYGEIKKTYW